MDPYEGLPFSLNPNGTLNRASLYPLSTSSPDLQPSIDALSKDITLNTANQTSLRIYLPKTQLITNNKEIKLPVIIYIHGGGFVLISTATSFEHDACVQRAANIPALIISVDYRLAPEHRLPAAYDDAVEALLWVRNQARSTTEPWLKDHADFSNCFIMGTSAGGNIAYNLALRLVDLHIEPLRINGVILSQPFFGGVERTESEARSVDDPKIPLRLCDVMWELALPKGADRDHEYCNPVATFAKAKALPRCLVMGFVGDPLLDRMWTLAQALETEGVSVVTMMEDEGSHGIDLFDPEKAKVAMTQFRRFIYA